jgi:DNA-binding transcriptional regulator GbsR (MarR family)
VQRYEKKEERGKRKEKFYAEGAFFTPKREASLAECLPKLLKT